MGNTLIYNSVDVLGLFVFIELFMWGNYEAD